MAVQSRVCGNFDKEGKVGIVVPQGGLHSLILGILAVKAIWLEQFMFDLKPRRLSILHADRTSGARGGLYFAESAPYLQF